MKISVMAVVGMMLVAGAAVAGPRVGVYVNFGGYGCAPRHYAPPICYSPPVVYCAPRTIYYQPSPAYYAPAPVIYAPAYPSVYRAPLLTTGVNVSAVPFRWRR